MFMIQARTLCRSIPSVDGRTSDVEGSATLDDATTTTTTTLNEDVGSSDEQKHDVSTSSVSGQTQQASATSFSNQVIVRVARSLENLKKKKL